MSEPVLPTVADPIAALMSSLRLLVGTWHGRGQGHFPTIEPFTYHEELVFEVSPGKQVIHYEQKTWQSEGDDKGEPLHWESGFFVPRENGWVEIASAQNGGRVEVLAGPLQRRETGFELVLNHVVLANDPRMRASHRTFRLAGDTLSYDMSMETTRVSPIEHHLGAKLQRQNKV